ncbi:MAG: alpha/beta hydrolase [Hellea sp.]|nr:alpha/beta hydrolase [Hellea sp.]
MLFTKFALMGQNLSKYDRDWPISFDTDPNSDGAKAVENYLVENFINPASGNSSVTEKLSAKRARFESNGLSREIDGEYREGIANFGDISVSGEWSLAKGSDADRRILYIHGGAFTVGSAVSHRAITGNLSKKTGCAVFAPNYRLMPENSRLASVEDCQAAYRWILENGPDGPKPIEKLAIVGDSAGGNLTLVMAQWARDNGVRPADAIVGISAATDSTYASPSIKDNFDTDLMLKPLAAPLLKIPRPLLVWFVWKQLGVRPTDPRVSPLRGDLSGLPPTLLHASAHEMMFDDSARYVAKAQSQGSDARLQSWSHLCHVWHMFDTMLPEAHEAIDEIANFITDQME